MIYHRPYSGDLSLIYYTYGAICRTARLPVERVGATKSGCITSIRTTMDAVNEI